MAYYLTSKCSNCGYKIKFMERTGWADYENDFGISIDKCASCGEPYSTGKTVWSKMSVLKKCTIYFKVTIKLLYTAFAYLIFILIGLSFLSFLIGEALGKENSPEFLTNFKIEDSFSLIIVLYFVAVLYVSSISFKNLKYLKSLK